LDPTTRRGGIIVLFEDAMTDRGKVDVRMKMADEKHIRELVERHTFEYRGVRYRTELWRMRFDPRSEMGVPPIAVDLDFTATPLTGGEVIRVQLHLGLDSAENDAFLLDALDNTIKKIVDGDLPPGTRALL
jgi:hypothetical protein